MKKGVGHNVVYPCRLSNRDDPMKDSFLGHAINLVSATLHELICKKLIRTFTCVNSNLTEDFIESLDEELEKTDTSGR